MEIQATPTKQGTRQGWNTGIVWVGRSIASSKKHLCWLWHKITPDRHHKPKQQRRRQQRTWIDQTVDGAFLLVTSLAFLVFLVASLPHVAYFIVTFEPQNPDGTLSDWWWTVAYLIAGAINITEFLLSIKFARDLRNATRGLPWYQKFIPTFTTALKYWPFIILISGFSWAANLEHAEQFHSSMLYTAERVKVILPFLKEKTWGDLNPYIVSAYPVLNIAYTLMFDSSRSAESESEQDCQPGSASQNHAGLQPTGERDFTHLLQAMQAMNAQQFQALQEMQRESLKATVDTLRHLAGVKASRKEPHFQAGEKKPGVTAARKGSAYEAPIKALYLKNPHITAVEAGRSVGCSHVTAAAILKSLRPVKVTPVEEAVSRGESESVEGESA